MSPNTTFSFPYYPYPYPYPSTTSSTKPKPTLFILFSLSFFSSPPLSAMASPVHSTPPPPPPPPDPPSAVPLALTVQPLSSSSRRLPPPCWSPDETLALIDAYRDKWYSLGRGNLKATHWQEVADTVSQRCPNASPPKTPVQCRHKMEKLRKRYRTEIQRARSLPVARFNSSWVHFKLMDSMEKGPSPIKPEIDSDSHDGDGVDRDDDNDDDEDRDLYDIKNGHGHGSNTRSLNKLYRNGFGGSGGVSGSGGGGVGGFRIRIPTGLTAGHPGSKVYGGKVGNQKPNPNSSSNYGTRVLGKKRERDPVGEVVSAIKVLGDGFVRMEQMKMEMAREIETMRMDMEMKRTEMILDSQHRIVEAFAKAVSDKKNKTKRMPDPQQQQQQP